MRYSSKGLPNTRETAIFKRMHGEYLRLQFNAMTDEEFAKLDVLEKWVPELFKKAKASSP